MQRATIRTKKARQGSPILIAEGIFEVPAAELGEEPAIRVAVPFVGRPRVYPDHRFILFKFHELGHFLLRCTGDDLVEQIGRNTLDVEVIADPGELATGIRFQVSYFRTAVRSG